MTAEINELFEEGITRSSVLTDTADEETAKKSGLTPLENATSNDDKPPLPTRHVKPGCAQVLWHPL